MKPLNCSTIKVALNSKKLEGNFVYSNIYCIDTIFILLNFFIVGTLSCVMSNSFEKPVKKYWPLKLYL